MNVETNIPVITIDGPSGTGKGTLCHLLAEHLHWHLLDSGAIYRVLAYAAREKQIHWEDVGRLVNLATHLDLRFETRPDEETKIMLNGKNIIASIRTEQCGQDASIIAAIAAVREALLERQRAFAIAPGLVTDGRDMGTVVFPRAFLKIYLHASEQERAMRRYTQLKKKENHVSLAQVVHELAQRDARDAARSHAPLKPAEDAVDMDTTGLSILQVFDQVLTLIKERGMLADKGEG